MHVAGCTSDEPVLGLHVVFGDNVLGVKRELWDPDTLEKQPLDCSQYEALVQLPRTRCHLPNKFSLRKLWLWKQTRFDKSDYVTVNLLPVS